jgi:uncharacterized protein YneF (UPF0154 family)
MIRQHNLPACPDSLQIRHYIAYPSAVIVFILIALLSLLFAVLVGFKYNSVKIFNRKIRRENISNTTWIMYYMVVAIRAAFLSVEFAWDISSEVCIRIIDRKHAAHLRRNNVTALCIGHRRNKLCLC